MQFHAIKYSGRIKICKKCNKPVVEAHSIFYTSKNKRKYCTHKKCVNCNINYVKNSLLYSISEQGKNPNVIMDGEVKDGKIVLKTKKSGPSPVVKITPKKILYVTTYSGILTSCPKCKGQIVNTLETYSTIGDKIATCTVEKCYSCNINYMNKTAYGVASSFGDNKNIIVVKDLGLISTPKATMPTPHKTISGKLEDVYVYKSMSKTCESFHRQFIDFIPLELKNAITGNKQIMNVFYCKKCNKRFITIEAITKYTSKCYIPQFKCNLQEFDGALKDVSILKLYGYSVQEGVLSEKQRHAIIDFVLDYKIMTPSEVINLLEFNIKFHGPKKVMQEACEKWHDDIQYIFKEKKLKQ